MCGKFCSVERVKNCCCFNVTYRTACLPMPLFSTYCFIMKNVHLLRTKHSSSQQPIWDYFAVMWEKVAPASHSCKPDKQLVCLHFAHTHTGRNIVATLMALRSKPVYYKYLNYMYSTAHILSFNKCKPSEQSWIVNLSKITFLIINFLSNFQ